MSRPSHPPIRASDGPLPAQPRRSGMRLDGFASDMAQCGHARPRCPRAVPSSARRRWPQRAHPQAVPTPRHPRCAWPLAPSACQYSASKPGADRGLTGPLTAGATHNGESANGGQTRGSWPAFADAGRSGPEPEHTRGKIGPAGFAGGAGRREAAARDIPEASRDYPLARQREWVAPAGFEPAITES